jgi:ribA/ribD-fused uncharacterized protein
MAEKARLFGDEAARQLILQTPDPALAKQLGRRVQGFAEQPWSAAAFAVVVHGNLAKFTQNPALAAYLLSTGDSVLVEASPLDPIWGIGLAADHPDAREPQRWRGQNLLGFALMSVRRQIAAGL